MFPGVQPSQEEMWIITCLRSPAEWPDLLLDTAAEHRPLLSVCPQDGSDVLQFQRFRVFHPLPKQAHHGILKTLWDKRVQWNQGLNARRTKQLLQVSSA